MTYVADSKRLTLAGARKMVETAVALAAKENFAITIAVADAGGHLVLLERMDGGRFHTVHSSTTKAATSAARRAPGRWATPSRALFEHKAHYARSAPSRMLAPCASARRTRIKAG